MFAVDQKTSFWWVIYNKQLIKSISNPSWNYSSLGFTICQWELSKPSNLLMLEVKYTTQTSPNAEKTIAWDVNPSHDGNIDEVASSVERDSVIGHWNKKQKWSILKES